ncbi:lycopene beta-cyclase CrtY [Halopseudomonas nanhaiensis]|uniref:lycopene beta-cyclase CrtY n=1 Tax=Halopseudomonas nanhaiensis TaxID=2830842 RepID=UPI001CBBD3E3|nr:lycopene beta-cyclase CrtY [Halopseudomonas nanhaiensis]UAW98737.1 lycopene beta-cyclase CrtY [Halopseudomonas nanhaiensis]
MSHGWDLILAGGGLANGLIAWRIAQRRPDWKILVLEQGERLGGNHTWSFHQGDLSEAEHAWMAPLVEHRWAGYRVRFPALQRDLPGGYASIPSERFAERLHADLGERVRTGVGVTAVEAQRVRLNDGQWLEARAVIDGRGPRASAHLALGWQAFLGMEVQLTAPHGLTLPWLMDADVEQGAGYRFVYVLPLAADRLLIEDTHYVDQPLIDSAFLRRHVREYASRQGWTIERVIREEAGALPITLAGDFDAFWREMGDVPCSGLRAGLFHPTTGYSLPHAVRLADRIAALPALSSAVLLETVRDEARRQWRQQGYFRLLNRMLFLAGRPDQRWRVMQRFYRLPERLIERFYAGRLTALDKLRIVTGKPPVPMAEALRAARMSAPQHIRISE